MRSPGSKGPEGLRREPADELAQLLADDALADQLVGEIEVGEEVVVEEVAERAVAHVVEQPRHAQQLLEAAAPRARRGTPP